VEQKAIRFKIFQIFHALIWLVWAILIYNNTGIKPEACFNQLFGQYTSYSAFNWIQYIYMFGGGLLLMRLLVKRMKLWSFILFEAIIVLIIIANLKTYFSCH